VYWRCGELLIDGATNLYYGKVKAEKGKTAEPRSKATGVAVVHGRGALDS